MTNALVFTPAAPALEPASAPAAPAPAPAAAAVAPAAPAAPAPVLLSIPKPELELEGEMGLGVEVKLTGDSAGEERVDWGELRELRWRGEVGSADEENMGSDTFPLLWILFSMASLLLLFSGWN